MRLCTLPTERSAASDSLVKGRRCDRSALMRRLRSASASWSLRAALRSGSRVSASGTMTVFQILKVEARRGRVRITMAVSPACFSPAPTFSPRSVRSLHWVGVQVLRVSLRVLPPRPASFCFVLDVTRLGVRGPGYSRSPRHPAPPRRSRGMDDRGIRPHVCLGSARKGRHLVSSSVQQGAGETRRWHVAERIDSWQCPAFGASMWDSEVVDYEVETDSSSSAG